MVNQEYRKILTNIEKKIYDQLLDCYINFGSYVILSEIIDYNLLEKINDYILLDNPRIFYIESYTVQQNSLGYFKLIPTYKYNHHQVEEIDKKIDKIIESIISKTKGNNDWEKIVSLHYILSRNISYDLDNYNAHNIIGAFLEKHAVCDGISKAFKCICDKLNILCVVATGRTNSSTLTLSTNNNHAWNKVMVFNEWCNLDITFDFTMSFNEYIRHDYCLISDDRINKTHKQHLNHLKLNCNTDQYSYFERYKMIASSLKELIFKVEENILKDIHIFEIRLDNVKRYDLLEGRIIKFLEQLLIKYNKSKYSYSINKEMSSIYIEIQ